MEFVQTRPVLTHSGVMVMLAAAIAQAEGMGVPQCIVIVDASGEVLGEVRMTGAKFLSRRSAKAKALTAASGGVASAMIAEAARLPLGMASQGGVTGLPGGLPVRFGGLLAGAIGVGSGTGEQDVRVAQAALAAVGADA